MRCECDDATTSTALPVARKDKMSSLITLLLCTLTHISGEWCQKAQPPRCYYRKTNGISALLFLVKAVNYHLQCFCGLDKIVGKIAQKERRNRLEGISHKLVKETLISRHFANCFSTLKCNEELLTQRQIFWCI